MAKLPFQSDDIAEVKNYINGKGRQITSFKILGKSNKKPILHGQAFLNIRDRSTNKMESVPFEFPFPKNTSIKGAFEQFEDLAKAFAGELHKDMLERQKEEQSKIVTPQEAVPVPNLQKGP